MSEIKIGNALPVLKEDGRAEMNDRALESLEREFTIRASGRGQNVAEFAIDINTSHMPVYQLAAYIPSMIDEIRRLRAAK